MKHGQLECSCYDLLGGFIAIFTGCKWKGLHGQCITATVSSTPRTTTSTTTTTSSTTTTTPTTSRTTTSTTTTTKLEPSKTCGDQHLYDINGKWFCNEDTVQKGTLCELKCKASFFASDLKMKRRCTCNAQGNCKWNYKEVECTTTSTQPPPTTTQDPSLVCGPLNDDNGYWKCNKGDAKGSRCVLMCFGGYEQKRTAKRCVCKTNNPESCSWRGQDRQCIAISGFSTPAPTYDQVCEAIGTDENGIWDCTNGNTINSACQLKCSSGYRVNSISNKRKCKCSDKNERCSWNRYPIKCVPEDTYVEFASNIPTFTETDKCTELVTKKEMYADRYVPYEGDIVENGKWHCTKKRKDLPLSEHNIFGSKCELQCQEGYEVISDGRLRRCKYHKPTAKLAWSGRIRHCRLPAENSRILKEERSE